MINLLDNTPNQLTKFKTKIKNWVEINDDAHKMQNKYSQIKFKNSLLKSSLCDYRGVSILVSGTITITGERINNAAKRADERNKGVIFKNCAPFTDCIQIQNQNNRKHS